MTSRSTQLKNALSGVWRFQRKHTDQAPIVPEGDIRGIALSVVIAIMTFLACMALGGVNIINESAQNWRSQVAREATIQIRPSSSINMEKALSDTVALVKGFPGIRDAQIVSREATMRLLEPWLGTGLNIDDLPVPRLVIVTFDNGATPDLKNIQMAVERKIPNATFDDHRVWVDRLVDMANTIVIMGVTVFLLVLIAMIITVIFATRSTLSNNAHIIEVLHFIGAESGFVARQFDWYFFRTGLRGAFIGGLSAFLLFFMVSFWSSHNYGTPESNQMAVLFGRFSFGWVSIIETVALIVFVAFITMLTSRYTVIRQLREIDRHEADFFGKSV